jgi:hypothetical protein
MSSMKNKFLIIMLLLLAPAHFVGVQAQGPPPPPPPAKDYFPNTWEEYSFPDGKLRIRFPAKPTESTSTEERFKIHSLKYKGLIVYEASYVDYQVPIDDPQKVKDLLQALKSAALNSIRPKGVQIIAEREIAVDGHTGIFLHLEVGAKEVIRVQWIIAGSRLYTISASSRKGSPLELEGKDDYEKVALGFINSFHVMP